MLKSLALAAMLLSATSLTAANAANYGMSSSSSSMMAPSTMMKTSPMAAPWHRAHTAKGTIWVDSRGFALYTYDKDTAGASNCYGMCAVAWPPFRAAMGAHASGNWTIVMRMGFSGQWAYNGHPLYFWFKDTQPGQVTGDGVDGFHVAR